MYNRNLFDNTIGKTWPAMTVDERRLSIPNGRNVVWIGSEVTAAVPSRLALGCLCSGSARRPPSPANTTLAPPSSAGR